LTITLTALAFARDSPAGSVTTGEIAAMRAWMSAAASFEEATIGAATRVIAIVLFVRFDQLDSSGFLTSARPFIPIASRLKELRVFAVGLKLFIAE